MIRSGIIAQLELSDEPEEALPCNLTDGGDGSRPVSIAASGADVGAPFTPSPSQPLRLDGLGAWPLGARDSTRRAQNPSVVEASAPQFCG